MSSNPIENLFSDKSEIDVKQKIVEELLNNKNLETKTELKSPLSWSCMTTLETFLESKNLKISASILNGFTSLSFKYLISKERKGRKEYIEALKTLSGMDKLNPIPNDVKSLMR